ncbi:MAG TPA: ABC transporter permease [Thermomicrobiales bacterium]|jgi:peptide/nickel transport system permease protein|nr:ABC transporter permease [Thermomicrobiales bacterium]
MSQMQAQLQMQSTAIGGMRQAQALGYWQRAFRHLRQDKVTVFAFFLLLIITLLSVGAGVIGQAMDLDPNKTNLLTRMKPPSREHWLGTDDVGRDVFIRLLYAGRVSLLVGVLSAATAFVIGVSLGLLSGFYGRWVDDSVNALIQTTINIPLLFLLILLSVIFRPGVAGLAVIIGLFSWQNNARQIRAAVLSQKERDFVDAARVLGSGDGRLMWRHIFPNVVSIVLVVTGFDVAGAILAESSLSALGLGVQPPTASWGNMLAKSFDFGTKAPWLVVSPGVMIALTVFSIFLLADGIRDALDPRIS